MCIVPLSRYRLFTMSELRTAHSEHRDQTMSQAVAYKRLKKMDNYKTVSPKSGDGPGPGGHSSSQDVVGYEWF